MNESMEIIDLDKLQAAETKQDEKKVELEEENKSDST